MSAHAALYIAVAVVLVLSLRPAYRLVQRIRIGLDDFWRAFGKLFSGNNL